jgi:hypothetical protein
MNHKELLENAKLVDKIAKGQVKEVEVAKVKKGKVVTDDPFGGNENNRKVAEAVAKAKEAEAETEAATVDPVDSPAADPAATVQVEVKPVPPANPPVWKPNA